MSKQQVKFYVTEKEMERLKFLSEMRYMTVPNYAKLTALGVQIRQPKEIVVGNVELQEEDKAVLKEILERRRGISYIAYDTGFNQRLEQLAKRLLGEEK
ncbi:MULTISPECIES: hypothetical protein [Bacillus cereus group]|uniref:Uncharacterized protein n=1 Tax=Bacillus thuringiensis TaxID=1428 RepID=A0A9X6V8N7_BACTU|nr:MULTISPECIES: hypothetical protein [Bacillus cereus group]KIP29636.1 hypothetical protein BG10_7187 [Bacillus thuringiensis serovar morrisoni]KIP29642.1 hypothetical protein BG10_7180 [Bacillus thuringiensis serovar morrisoni]MCU5282896.1 hypothetical protein [Bacillus cereus]MEC3021289.1 hypothetical protein [Bacillus cereus]MEC3261246.1 hypothetical protein [Bacillus cereus]